MHLLDYERLMRLAIAEAKRAPDHGDVPIGAVLARPDGTVLTSDHNRREELQDPTAHAEMLVITGAASELRSRHLDEMIMVVTVEPCPMCAGAAVWARLGAIVYGAPDPKAGAVWSLYNIPQDARLNHRCEVVAGVLRDECAAVLREFFEQRRT